VRVCVCVCVREREREREKEWNICCYLEVICFHSLNERTCDGGGLSPHILREILGGYLQLLPVNMLFRISLSLPLSHTHIHMHPHTQSL